MPAGWVAAGSAILGAVSSMNQADAAKSAANTQAGAAQAGIAENQRQFDAVQKLLAPYVTAGTGALGAQQDLLGIGPNGAQGQQAAINAIQASPAYTSALAAGNRNILANGSATGGLRGGNTQAALGQFAPQLLAQIIQQQYGNLGGMTSIGQNAAAGVGNAGMQTGNTVASLLQQQGAAQAGGALGQAAGYSNMLNSFTNGLGMYATLRNGTPSPGFNYDYGNTYNPSATMGNDQFGWKGGGSGF